MATIYGIKVQTISTELKFRYSDKAERDEALVAQLTKLSRMSGWIEIGDIHLCTSYVVHYQPYEAKSR